MNLRVALAVILVWGAMVSILLRGLTFVGSYNDDCTYIALARTMAQARGYVDPSILPLALHTRYPPLFPLSLMPAQWVRPRDLGLLRAQALAVSELALVALFFCLRRVNLRLGTLASFLTCNAMLWGLVSTGVMSDVPFLLLASLWLWVGERRDWRRTSPRAWFWIGLLTLLACGCRAIGVLLIPALVAVAWRGGARKSLLATVLVLCAVFGPYLLLQWQSGYGGQTDQVQFRVDVSATNLMFHVITLPLSLWVDPQAAAARPTLGVPLLVLAGLTWLLVGLGWRQCWTRGYQLTCLYVLFNTLFVLFFPFWPILHPRYDLQLLPFFYLCALEGFSLLGSRAAAVAAFTLAAAQCFAWAGLVQVSVPVTAPATLAWLSHRPEPRVCAAESWIWLYTGKSVQAADDDYNLQHTEEAINYLDKSDCRLLVASAGSGFEAWLAGHPTLFQRVPGQPGDGLAVYQLTLDHRTLARAYAAYRNGERWMEQRSYANSAARLEQSLQLAPWMPNAHTSLAYVLWRQGEAEAALRELDLALQLDPALRRAQGLRRAIR